MRSTSTALLLLSSCFLSVACQGTGPTVGDVSPLVVQQRFEVSYAAQLGPVGFDDEVIEDPSRDSADRIPDAAAARGEVFAGQGAPSGAASIQTFELSDALARRLLAPELHAPDPQTGVATLRPLIGGAGLLESESTQKQIQALLVSGRVKLLDATRVRGKSGQGRRHSILKQTAYVQRFKYERSRTSWVADPVVDVARSGLVCDLRLQSQEAQGRPFEVDIEVVRLLDPLPLVVTDVIEGMPGLPITIQTPIYRKTHLGLEASVGPDQLIYVITPGYAGPSGEDRKVLLTLIQVKLDQES